MNTMKSKLFFIFGLIIFLAACGGGSTEDTSSNETSNSTSNDSSQNSDDIIEWNLSVWGAPRAFTDPVDEWAETMKEKTDGRWIINVEYGEALGPTSEALEGISAGLFEAAGVVPYWTPGKLPLQQVLDLPFLMPLETGDIIRMQMYAWENEHILNELAEWNAVPLLPTAVPQAEYMGTKKIEKAEDFDGVRIAGLGAEASIIFEEFGAVPSPLETTEIFDALDKGTIDGVIYAYTYSLGAYSLHEASKYYTRNLASGQPSMFMVANKDAWDALPEEFKEYHREFYEKMPEIAEKYYEKADQEYEPLFEEMLEKVEFPEEERAKLQEKAQIAWDAWVENWKDRGPTREILEDMLKKSEEFK